jgi:hypothetical protein
MSNTRDSNGRAPKETVPPDLKHALSLLRLESLSDLEERFLSVNAFLKPWSVFRDSVFLRFPDAMPRATTVATIQNVEDPGSGVSRLDLLWFYTQFDDGGLRYDPRADQWTTDYNPDISTYGVIEKSEWRVGDYEKHLYAWLLQEFKVGKGYSPWRFEYLEGGGVRPHCQRRARIVRPKGPAILRQARALHRGAVPFWPCVPGQQHPHPRGRRTLADAIPRSLGSEGDHEQERHEPS